MKFVLKIITAVLILTTTCCSFLNDKAVFITINSHPADAKIYIDNTYYGTTIKEIDLVPNKNYQLTLVKDGYRTVNINMETTNSMREGLLDYSKCRMDFFGSIFIFPILGLKSVYCRDFTKRVYDVDLEEIASVNSQENISNSFLPSSYNPFFTRNYYLPPQATEQQNNPQMLNNSTTNQNPTQSQPIFNNQSEFVNNGNEPNPDNNFNRKTKVDYYNWQ